MGRGQFCVWRRKDGSEGFGVRFYHRGRRRLVRLGSSDDMTRKQAEMAMADLMSDVRRGIWTAPEDREPEPEQRAVPSFHEFASEWFQGRLADGGRHGRGLSEKSEADLLWRLRDHVLPFLASYRLDEVNVEVIDRFRRALVNEGRLGPTSINKMIATTAAIMEAAVEYGYVERNPAKGRRRRLSVSRPARTFLDRATWIAALLDAAGELDREGRGEPYRRAMLAVFVFAGLRISELRALTWGCVDLAGGLIRVPGTKTENAARVVRILPALRDELAALAAQSPDRDRGALVFATTRVGERGGGQHSATNIRRRVLGPAVERANTRLAEIAEDPIPHLTPHSLRRTYASLLVGLGEDPATVMVRMGHATAHFTLGVYAAAMNWRDGERERLRALVEGTYEAPNRQEMGNTAAGALDATDLEEAA